MRKGGTFLAFLSGLVVGALTAVLLVPESGETTRKRLKETGLQRLRDLEREIHRLREEIRERIAQLRSGTGEGEEVELMAEKEGEEDSLNGEDGTEEPRDEQETEA